MTAQEYNNLGFMEAAQRHGHPVADEYAAINRRCDLERAKREAEMVQYEPPQAAAPEPVVTLGMKRFIVTGGFTTFFVVVIAAAKQGAFAAGLAMGGNIVAVGGGLGLVVLILRACFTLKQGDTAQQANAAGGAKWEEFYQKQEQGYRRQV